MDWYENFKKMSDDELSSWVSSNAQLGSDASNLAIAELTRRSIAKNEEAIKRLEKSISQFNEISNKYSQKIIYLTVALVILTIIIAIPIFIDILNYFKK